MNGTAINAPAATDFRSHLQRELIERCRKNGNYSLRAFARTLKIDASTLSQILRGQRKLTQKSILALSARLGLSPADAARFAGTALPTQVIESPGRSAQELTLDAFHIISDWYHYAIFELVTVTGFKPESRWIARKLGITVSEVHIAVDRLFRLELLKRDKKGRWIQGSPLVTTTGNPFTATAFRKHQAQLLEKAAHALENVPLELRDNSGMTLSISRRQLPEAKAMIKKFRKEFCEFLQNNHERDAVYQLAVAFYPLTQDQTKEG